ncbi:hypothetical protein [Weeksella virosa]|uniref:hypothetical protein n=1 Tax=Weeksella virosa TaxID=1014 RepID=UPI0005A51401|nr:hypothetical protein [Weeksella virosa]MDK7675071.1 hypothetical protein [Weeksella virosa]
MNKSLKTRETANGIVIEINFRLSPQNNRCDKHLPEKKNMRLLKFLEDCEHYDISLPASKVKQLILQNFPEIVHCNPTHNNLERFEGHKSMQSSLKINNSAEAPDYLLEKLYCQW